MTGCTKMRAAAVSLVVWWSCRETGGPPPPPPPPPPPGTPARLVRTLGDGQTGAPSQTLPLAYALRVVDVNGDAVADVTVHWSARRGVVSDSVSTTGAEGLASTVAMLSSTAGPDTVLAAVDGLAGSLRFVSHAVTGPTIVAQVPIPANYGLHDTFVRAGLVFASAWNSGIITYDVGGGTAGGGPAAPAPIDTIRTADNGVAGGRQSHNVWWFHNTATTERRYLFVGQEGPSNGTGASGDIHVVDVSDLAHAVQVGSYRMSGAGAHNFWMDEDAQVLYAAYYNGGVLALDVSGTLRGDLASLEIARIQPGGAGNTLTWGVQVANGSVYAVDMLSGVWQLQLNDSALTVAGGGNNVPDRFSSDFWVHGNHIYSGTWGNRSGNVGNVVKIWRLDAAGAPQLVDSIIAAGIGSVSDVQVSADGRLLVFSAEGGTAAGLHVYGLTDPESPNHLWSSPLLSLHTATIADIGGRRYVFAAKNPSLPAMIVFDITTLTP